MQDGEINFELTMKLSPSLLVIFHNGESAIQDIEGEKPSKMLDPACDNAEMTGNILLTLETVV